EDEPDRGLLAPATPRQDPRRHAEEVGQRQQREQPHYPAPAGRDTGEEAEGEARIPDEGQRDEPRNDVDRDSRRQPAERDELDDLIEDDDDAGDGDDARDAGTLSADHSTH